MALKVWNGSSWVDAIALKVWNGSAWINAIGKVWNGSAWTQFIGGLTQTTINLFAKRVNGGNDYPTCANVTAAGYKAGLTGSTISGTTLKGQTINEISFDRQFIEGVSTCEIYYTQLTVQISGATSQSFFTSVNVMGTEYYTNAVDSWDGSGTWIWVTSNVPSAIFSQNTNYDIVFSY